MILLYVRVIVVKINTKVLPATDDNIATCAAALRDGKLVAFPTETVYALGAVATDAVAVTDVFDVKNRPHDRPLIVAVADKADIRSVAKSVPQKAQRLIDELMPGALTLLFDRADCIPDAVTSGGESVAVRIPDNKIALRLIELTGAPVVVPSANTSEKPSPTLAEHVRADLDGKIEYILDGGQSEIGIESTIVDVRTEPPAILRVGGVTKEQIESVIGPVRLARERSKSGAFIPTAEVMFSAFYPNMEQTVCKKYDELAELGRTPVILCLDGNRDKYGERKTFTVGGDYREYAHNLFAALRRADAEHYDTVIAEGVDATGLGLSLVERLIKLSGGMII